MALKPTSSKLAILFFSASFIASSADWVTARGDAQRTACQLNEKTLSVTSVKRLRLLWNKQLGTGTALMTDPLILGPFITHRGIKELVIARNSADTLYAIDADLGTLFWTRPLRLTNSNDSPPLCPSQRVTPGMSTPPVAIKSKAINDDDDFSDGNRPIYVFSADSTLQAIRPSNGEAFYPPLSFLPPHAVPSTLQVVDGVASITSSAACGEAPDHRWNVQPNAQEQRLVATPQPGVPGAEQPGSLRFNWKHGQVSAAFTREGCLTLRDASSRRLLCRGRITPSGAVLGLATAESAAGKRALYSTSSHAIAAFDIASFPPGIQLKSMWIKTGVTPLSAPVIANGVLYALMADPDTNTESVRLEAFNLRDGLSLYRGDPVPANQLRVTNLALANGHLVFGTGDGVLHCFGFPIDL